MFFKGPFRGAYFLIGLSTEGNLHFQMVWASLIVESKFTIFALLYFVFEGFLCYHLGGLIFGGAYKRRCLFLEFYSGNQGSLIHQCGCLMNLGKCSIHIAPNDP